MFFEKIKEWDDILCEQHVGNSVNYITTLFKANNISSLNYIDIGSNVGKVYDVLVRSISVHSAWMFEASPTLFAYIKEKYKNNSAVKLTHAAISNVEQEIVFSEESLLWQLNQDSSSSLNLGLSKITGDKLSNVNVSVQSKKISNIIRQDKYMLDICNFIKIDTETVDILILEDLLTVISEFKTKPVIEFEINYNALGMTTHQAQNIIDQFASCGYRSINMSCCRGDGYLIPEFLQTPHSVLCF